MKEFNRKDENEQLILFLSLLGTFFLPMGNARRLLIDETPILGEEQGPVRNLRNKPRINETPYKRKGNKLLIEEKSASKESILEKIVRNIVGWFAPGGIFPEEDRSADEKALIFEGSRDCLYAESAIIEEHVDAQTLYRQLLTEKSRRAIYKNLAAYFRAKGDKLLTKEESEELSMVIQRQAPVFTRPRKFMTLPTPGTVFKKVEPLSRGNMMIDATLADASIRVSAVGQPDVPSEGDTAILPPPRQSPVKRKPRSRVFSARFDDEDDHFESPRKEHCDKGGMVISETRKKLIEEARRRVADQIKLSQKSDVAIETKSNEPKPSVSFDLPKETKVELKSEAPKFDFIIASGPESVNGGNVPSDIPKLVFDFDTEPKFGKTVIPSIEASKKGVTSTAASSLSFRQDAASPLTLPPITEKVGEEAATDTALDHKMPSPFGMLDEKNATNEESKGFSFGNAQKMNQAAAPVSGNVKPFTFDFSSKQPPAFKVGESSASSTADKSAPVFGSFNAGFSFGGVSAQSSAPAMGLQTTKEAKASPFISTATPSIDASKSVASSSGFSFTFVAPPAAPIVFGSDDSKRSFGEFSFKSSATDTKTGESSSFSSPAPGTTSGFPHGIIQQKPTESEQSNAMVAFANTEMPIEGKEQSSLASGFSFGTSGSTLSGGPADNTVNKPSLFGSNSSQTNLGSATSFGSAGIFGGFQLNSTETIKLGKTVPPVPTFSFAAPPTTTQPMQFQFGGTTPQTFSFGSPAPGPQGTFAFGQASGTPQGPTAPTTGSTAGRKFSVPTTKRRK